MKVEFRKSFEKDIGKIRDEDLLVRIKALAVKCWNGSKKAGIKVGEHFAENNVWAKGAIAKRCCVRVASRREAQIAFLEGVNEDGK